LILVKRYGIVITGSGRLGPFVSHAYPFEKPSTSKKFVPVFFTNCDFNIVNGTVSARILFNRLINMKCFGLADVRGSVNNEETVTVVSAAL
jgi:hypothetical protein